MGDAAQVQDARDEVRERIAEADEVIGLLEAADQAGALTGGERRDAGDEGELLRRGRAHGPRRGPERAASARRGRVRLLGGSPAGGEGWRGCVTAGGNIEPSKPSRPR